MNEHGVIAKGLFPHGTGKMSSPQAATCAMECFAENVFAWIHCCRDGKYGTVCKAARVSAPSAFVSVPRVHTHIHISHASHRWVESVDGESMTGPLLPELIWTQKWTQV